MPIERPNVLTNLTPQTNRQPTVQQKPLPALPNTEYSPYTYAFHQQEDKKISTKLVQPIRPTPSRKYHKPEDYQDAAAQYIDAVLKLAKLELNDTSSVVNEVRERVINRAIELNSSRLALSAPVVINSQVQAQQTVISTGSSTNSSISAAQSIISASVVPVTIRCSGWTQSGTQCKRTVRSNAGVFDRIKDIERFCYQHRTRLLQPSGFYSSKGGEWVRFGDWIPKYLHADTQAALRIEMEKPPSFSDVPGYIYAFEIRDPTSDKLKLKVGRAVNVVKRIDEWDKQCGTHEHVLRGFYPEVDNNNKSRHKSSSRLKGLVKPGDPAPRCHRLERLVHLELADLAARCSYLDPSWPNSVSAATNSRALQVYTSANGSARSSIIHCIDCGKAHLEIFEFVRAKQAKHRNKEWEMIVLPVIRKWGEFTGKHL